MELSQARILVVGATGVLGGAITDALLEAGARVVPAGRDPERLAQVGERCGTSLQRVDVVDVESCRAAVDGAAETLGGLDGLVVATGVAAFGPAAEADEAVVEELFAVNTLAPMALVRAAAPHLDGQGCVVVLSAILADVPTVGMAEYSATKSALSAWLHVARRELRPLTVIDVRPPHVDTGLADRPLAGAPPKLPAGFPAADVVEAVLQAMRDDAREVTYDLCEKALKVV